MIVKDANKHSLKEIKARERAAKEAAEKALYEAVAIERLGSLDELVKLSNANKGLWYMGFLDDEGNVDKLAILKPIDRHILSFASTKIEDEGLYTFLEAAMRECILSKFSDSEILEEEDYFIAAAQKFQKIMESKKASFLKR